MRAEVAGWEPPRGPDLADLVRSVVGAPDVHLVFHFAAQTAVTTSVVAPRADG